MKIYVLVELINLDSGKAIWWGESYTLYTLSFHTQIILSLASAEKSTRSHQIHRFSRKFPKAHKNLPELKSKTKHKNLQFSFTKNIARLTAPNSPYEWLNINLRVWCENKVIKDVSDDNISSGWTLNEMPNTK